MGKSQVLSNIVGSLLNQDNIFSDPKFNRPMISRLLALGTPGETVNTFPQERNKSKIKYRRLMLRRNSRMKNSRGFGELLLQLVRSDESIGEENRWQLFLNSVRDCLSFDGIVIPLVHKITPIAGHVLYINNEYYVSLKKLHHGGEQAQLEIWAAIYPKKDPVRLINGKLYPLSSGELAFLQFAVQACLFIENGTLVLLDEPETHLHPSLITSFIELLDNLLQQSGSIAILATHSAYFVREVSSEQVLVFKESEQGHISIERPILKTFGANVGAISHFVFEDKLANRLTKKIELAIENNPDARFKIFEELKAELSIEALMLLKEKYREIE